MEYRRFIVWWGGVVLLLLALLWLPVSYTRIIREGTDSYKAHTPIFGNHAKRETIAIDRDVIEIGVLIVNLRRADMLAPVDVKVFDKDSTLLASGTIQLSSIQDDGFSWAHLSHSVSKKNSEIMVEVAAPEAKSSNPIGWRFDLDSADHRMAVGVVESISLREWLVRWIDSHESQSTYLLFGVIAAAVFVVIGELVVFFDAGKKKWVWWGLLGCLGAYALWLRLPILNHVDGIFGGDAYNYLLKARAWIEGGDPFAADFRKAPLLAFLIIPGFLFADPLLFSRWVTILSSVVAVVLTALLLRRLKVPMVLAIVGGALLASAREFQFESVSALANIPYTALIVATALAFLDWQKKRVAYVMALLSGLVVLTRYEGVVVPVVLLPAVWVYHRFRWKFVLYTLLPLVVVLLLPFLLWPITGQVGVRTFSDIESDGGLQLGLGWYDFWLNAKIFKFFFGTMWFLIPSVGQQLGFFFVGLVVGAVGSRLKRLTAYVVYFPYVGLVWGLAVVVNGGQDAFKFLSLGLTFLTGWGVGWLLLKRPKWSMPVFLMLLLQIVSVTMILPKSRYYIQLLPFLAVAIVMALMSVADWKKRVSRIGICLLAGLMVGFVLYDAQVHLPGMISEYNDKAVDSAVGMRAALFVRSLPPGLVGLSDPELRFRAYVGDKNLRVFPSELPPTDTAQLEWIKENHIQYVVENSFIPLFSVLESRPELFEHLGKFTSHYGKGEMNVFRVR